MHLDRSDGWRVGSRKRSGIVGLLGLVWLFGLLLAGSGVETHGSRSGDQPAPVREKAWIA